MEECTSYSGEGEAIGLAATWMELEDEPSLGSKQLGGSQEEGGPRSLGAWKRLKVRPAAQIGVSESAPGEETFPAAGGGTGESWGW